jgi:hypothetical protein
MAQKEPYKMSAHFNPNQPPSRAPTRAATLWTRCARAVSIGVLGAAALLVGSAVAHADGPPVGAPAVRPVPKQVIVDLMAIHGVQGPPPGSIDPKLASVAELKQPPLSAYNTYRLLDQQALTVPLDTPVLHQLPNGRTLQVTVRAVPGNQYLVTAAINRPEGGDFLKQLEITTPAGKRFFVAGQSYQGGTLMLALGVRQ